MPNASDDRPQGPSNASAKGQGAEPPSATDPLEGTGYRAVKRLRQSELSEIYLAQHLKLDSRVVIKILRQPVAAAPDAADRLRLESQALARLDDEHLVSVLDCGVAGGRPFFVMAPLPGRSLADELGERRALPVGEAVDIARQILAGLEVVHGHGLVHRDIHPENLFLRDADQARPRTVIILDFDVLKLADGPQKLGLDPLVFSTADGVTVGTPSYGSPEQILGQPVDVRADLYAVGAVLYRMLAGREAFAHCEDLSELLRAKLEADPEPPSSVARQPIPEALDRLIQSCLSRDPAARPRSAVELAAILEGIADDLAGRSDLAEPPPARADTLPPKHGRSALAPGARCGPYEIVREIGRGAMGVVYLARTSQGQDRALKVLELDARARKDLGERFKREVQLLRTIDHAHVVRFYDAGLQGEGRHPLLWVALEYLRGQTLREVIQERGGKLSAGEICCWGHQIALGVGEAHKLAVVHRDLKPENIMIAGGVAKVFDFGMAQFRAWGVRLTAARRQLGTLPYMAPEQLDTRQQIDHRSDIFALGLILAEMALGRHPLSASDDDGGLDIRSVIFRQIAAEAKPLHQSIDGFPRDLSELIAKAMHRAPEQRFASMAEMADALQSVATPVAAEPTAALPQPVAAEPTAAVPQPIAAEPIAAVPQPIATELQSSALSSTKRRARLMGWHLIAAALVVVGVVAGAVLLRTMGGGASSADGAGEPDAAAASPPDKRQGSSSQPVDEASQAAPSAADGDAAAPSAADGDAAAPSAAAVSSSPPSATTTSASTASQTLGQPASPSTATRPPTTTRPSRGLPFGENPQF